MALIGDRYTTGDGLSLGVSLVLLEIPDEAWIKQVLISVFNTMTIEGNWNDDHGDITTDQAARISSLMLQTLQFDYEPPSVIPVGSTMIWHMETPPDGWLICDGTGVLKASYPQLYDLFGGKYGESVDFFGLPDLRSRVPYGADFVIELDDEAGEAEHTLITGEMPAHSHGVTDLGHQHRIPKASATADAGNTSTPSARTDNPAAPVMMTNVSTTGISINNTGGGNPHNNIPPVLGVNFIIFAGV